MFNIFKKLTKDELNALSEIAEKKLEITDYNGADYSYLSWAYWPDDRIYDE